MGLNRVRVQNYRALADVDIEVGPINVLFGPNGAGKSTLLDTVYFFRDCAIRGVEVASSERDHGIGLLWDGADKGARILVELAGGGVTYGLSFSLAAGRIDPLPGEHLVSLRRSRTLIERTPGSTSASLFNERLRQAPVIELREPNKISLGLFLDFNGGDDEAGHLDHLPLRSFLPLPVISARRAEAKRIREQPSHEAMGPWRQCMVRAPERAGQEERGRAIQHHHGVHGRGFSAL